MSEDMHQNVQGHNQENKAMDKSSSFENCTFNAEVTINVYSNGEEPQSITFTSSSTGNNSSSQEKTIKLPNDANTIIKVIEHFRQTGQEVPISLPDTLTVDKISEKSRAK